MNQKLKGILTSIGALIIFIILTFVVSIIVSTTSSDGWAGLAAVIMMLFATAIGLLILLVVGLVIYYKNKSQYGLGLIYGILGIVILSVVSSILISLYNMAVW